MSQLKKNIVANFVGNGWSALMGIVFVPIYIKFLGIDSFGLIGIYASLQALFGLLDIGLTTTLNREMARFDGQTDKAKEIRDLVRTLESIYWIFGAIIALVVFLLAPVIANYWVQPGKLSTATIQQAIMIMGLTISFQFIFTFYSGGLMGLQRQVLLNTIIIIVTTLKFVGVILVLWLVSSTIQTFFIWQTVIGVLASFLVAYFLWQSLPYTDHRARFDIRLLRGIWQFAVGMSGITILALILTQLDKIILSKMLTLESFGYYTLASVVAMSLFRLISPIFNAAYPKFTQLVSIGDQLELRKLYHRMCQTMSVIIIPPTLMIALFSSEILLLWTRNPITVQYTHTVLSLLIIGTCLNGLMNLPYALQLAYGWTKLAICTNIVSVIILVPLLIYMTRYYGPVGAACVWIILNSGYVFISLQLMHRRLLKGEKWQWYIYDVGYPLSASICITLLGRIILMDNMTVWLSILILVVTFLLSVISAGLTIQWLRRMIIDKIIDKKMMILKKNN